MKTWLLWCLALVAIHQSSSQEISSSPAKTIENSPWDASVRIHRKLLLPTPHKSTAEGSVGLCCQLWATFATDTRAAVKNSMGSEYQDSASRPVVLFLGGMLGLVPTYWYADLYGRLANSDIHSGMNKPNPGPVVIALDLLPAGPPYGYPNAAKRLLSVMRWVRDGGLERRLKRNGLKIDTSRLVLASHSSGAQSVVSVLEQLAAEDPLGFEPSWLRALILMDPVDAMGAPVYNNNDNGDEKIASNDIEENTGNRMLDTYPSFTKAPVLDWLRQTNTNQHLQQKYPPAVVAPKNKTQFLHYRLPMLVLSTGLCPVAGLNVSIPRWVDPKQLPPIFDVEHNSMWPACCPPYLGPDRFWKAMTGSQFFPAPYGSGPFRDRGDPKPSVSPSKYQHVLVNQDSDDGRDPASSREIRTDGGRLSAWLIHAHDFGHCDLLDDLWSATNRFMKLCKSVMDERAAMRKRRQNSTTTNVADEQRRRDGPPYANIFDMKQFRKLVGDSVGAFLRYALYDDERGRAFIEDPRNMGQAVELRQVYSRELAEKLAQS